MSKDTADVLERGGAYVNVHTAKNAAGEIRGQIKLLNHGTTTTDARPGHDDDDARPGLRRTAARVLGPDRPDRAAYTVVARTEDTRSVEDRRHRRRATRRRLVLPREFSAAIAVASVCVPGAR